MEVAFTSESFTSEDMGLKSGLGHEFGPLLETIGNM